MSEKPSRSSLRFDQLHRGIYPRPRERARLSRGRSRLHYQAVIESDPVAQPEDPTKHPSESTQQE